jgi:hypothetical protein
MKTEPFLPFAIVHNGTVIYSSNGVTAEQAARIKERFMNYRTYAVIYNANTYEYNIMFRDVTDTANEWYIDQDFPPMTQNAAHRIVAALNGG